MTHKEALQLIEQRDIDEVLMLSDALNQKQVHELFSVCRFRGILYRE
jgi:predicted GTPase